MVSKVDTKHPQYLEYAEDWRLMDDSLNERKIKGAGTLYLKKTTGQESFEIKYPQYTSPYERYKDNASFPEVVPAALTSMVGLAHRKPGLIEAHNRLNTDSITTTGNDVHELARRCTRQVLKNGRFGLLVDVDEKGEPYIATYDAKRIVNWDSKFVAGEEVVTLVVLEEDIKKDASDKFGHEVETQYRVLELIDGRYTSTLYDDQGNIKTTVNEAGETVEKVSGVKTAAQENLPYIPFVAVGSIGTSIDCDEIPLLPMARSAVKLYRLDADYQQSLHMTAESTAVISGGTTKEIDTIGAGILVQLEKDGKAYYMEVSGAGLDAQRLAINDEKEVQEKYGAELGRQTGQESGEALSIRMLSKHASLYSVTSSVAEGITQCLKWAQEMISVTGDASYTANQDFAQVGLDPQLLTALNTLVVAGTIPKEIVYAVFRASNATELTDEQIEALIQDTMP